MNIVIIGKDRNDNVIKTKIRRARPMWGQYVIFNVSWTFECIYSFIESCSDMSYTILIPKYYIWTIFIKGIY